MADTKSSNAYQYDAFISYSAEDKAFAERLEKVLENYKPPKDLNLPQRRLNVFRYETDMTGTEYYESIREHLSNSAKVIAVCSPGARKSRYVNEEIQYFSESNDPKNIIPLIVAGIPNNEALANQEEEKAFPQALCQVLEMPLAISYTGIDLKREKLNKGIFESSWYTLLANIFEISRDKIEQRDKKKQLQRRRVLSAVVISVISALSILTAIAFYQRHIAEQRRIEAVRQQSIATVRRLAAESKVAGRDRVKMALALEAYRRSTEQGLRIPDGEQALRDAVGEAGVCSLTGHTYVAFSPNNRWLVTGCNDGIACLWDLGPYYSRFKDYRGAFTDVLLLNPNSNYDPIFRLGGHKGKVCVTVFTPDSHHLITGGQDGTARIWDLTSDDPLQTAIVLHGHEKAIKVMTTSPDGHWLATAGEDGICRLWDLTAEDPSGKSQALRGHTAEVWSIGISPDSRWLATGSRDGTARLWDLAAEDPSLAPVVLGGHGDTVMDLAFTPDSRLLATGSFDGSPRLWNLTAADPSAGVAVLLGGGEHLRALVISPDGRWLATANHDTTARLWALPDGSWSEDAVVLAGHTRAIWNAVFTPDSCRLVTATDSGTLLIWDLTVPVPRATAVVLRGAGIAVLAVSPNGHWLAGSGWGSASLWSLRVENLVPLALRNGQGAYLTELEWLRYFPNEKYRNTGADFRWGQ